MQGTHTPSAPNTIPDSAEIPDPPLSKLRMLEEEFASLHAPLPPDYLALSDPGEKYRRLIALLHHQRRSALCISGGGIRSATFALGVIQGLAKHGVLSHFDYLSTVSGGGYIGSWLSGWIRRTPNGISGVAAQLAMDPAELASTNTTGNTANPSADLPPIGHLRRFSNYMTPKLGLLSADTWTVTATYLRNLIVNWVVFIPLLLGVLMIPRLCVPCTNFSTTAPWVFAMLTLGVGLVITGLTVTGLSVPSVTIERAPSPANDAKNNDRKAWLGQGGFLRGVFVPLAAAATCLTTAWAWYRSPAGVHGTIPPAWLFIAGGMGVYLLTFICTWLLGQRASLQANVRAYLRLSEFTAFPAVGLLAGALTYLEAAYLFPDPSLNPIAYICLASPIMIGIHFLAGTFYVGLTSRTTDPRDDEDREWWARAAGWLLIAIAAWAVFSAIVFYGPMLLTPGFWQAVVPAGGVFGAITMFLSSSSKTPAKNGTEDKKTWKTMLVNALLALAAPIFIVFLVAALSSLTDFILTRKFPDTPEEHRLVLINGDLVSSLVITLALLAIGMFAARIISLNKFSMHALYRNRLIRAYLGASRERRPNHFTGIDADDNLQMYALRSRPADGVSHLTDANIQDIPGLLGALRDPNHWLSIRIWPFCTRAADLGGMLDDTPEMQRALLADLNAIVAKEYLYTDPLDSGHLSRVVIERVGPPQTPASPGDPTLAERNRHLLEHVYEGHILPGAQRPLHVVNIALNLVSGDQLAWQERKAESFSVSALHCGNHRLGYRRSLFYGGSDGISLGTAVTISGAAASPNSGYHSSPPLALLMTFFNVRLGWWLGNPGTPGAPPTAKHGILQTTLQWIRGVLASLRRSGLFWAHGLDSRSYRHAAPRYSVSPIVKEAFGLTDETSEYVYLSDGGHFENLALYEMVLRRCRTIVLSDGGCDPECTFEDLGNAIRKIRVDLGIEISIDTSKLYCRHDENHAKGKYCAVGTIGYKNADGGDAEDGEILYLKPSLPGGEPADVRNYASTRKDFPHEPTADQWFSESQFESYRALGRHAVEHTCGNDPAWNGTPKDLIVRAREYATQARHDSHAGRVHEFAEWAREYIDTHLDRTRGIEATTKTTKNPDRDKRTT